MVLKYWIAVLGLLCGLSWTGYGQRLGVAEGAEEPAKTEPAKAEAAKAEPQKAEPAKTEAAKRKVTKAAEKVAPSQGKTSVYRVKRGDHLFKILRQQLGLQEKGKLVQAFNRVKELNPQKKNWDTLVVGERITLPGRAMEARIAPQAPAGAAQPPPKAAEVGLDYARKLPVKDNLNILEQVVEILGGQTQREGEEVLALKEGTVRLDRKAFPVVQSTKMKQKVVLDLEGNISSALKSRVESQAAHTAIISLRKGANLHDTVGNLLSRIGYQSLPSNRPVVIQDGGVEVQVKGEWMVLSPEAGEGRQEMWVVSLTDGAGRLPEYIRDYLSAKGMNLTEIPVPAAGAAEGTMESPDAAQTKPTGTVEVWPADKAALVEAFLRGHKINFSTDHSMALTLREGVLIETQLDRYFEVDGKKFAFLFRAATDEVKKALQEKEGIKVIELDIRSLSSRELISRLFGALGQPARYRDHHFPVADGAAREKVVLRIAGFYFPDRALLLTDRDIPSNLQRFFLEKGLRIVSFH